jgi:hypothetical protein
MQHLPILRLKVKYRKRYKLTWAGDKPEKMREFSKPCTKKARQQDLAKPNRRDPRAELHKAICKEDHLRDPERLRHRFSCRQSQEQEVQVKTKDKVNSPYKQNKKMNINIEFYTLLSYPCRVGVE